MALNLFPAAAAALHTMGQPVRVNVPTTDTVHAFVEAYAAAHLDGVKDNGANPPVLARVEGPAGGAEFCVQFILGRSTRRALTRRLIGGNGDNSVKRIRAYLAIPPAVIARIVSAVHTVEDDAVHFADPRAVVLACGQLDLAVRILPDGAYLVHHDKVAPFGVRSVRIGYGLTPVNDHLQRIGDGGAPVYGVPAQPVGVRHAFNTGSYQHEYIEEYASLHIRRIKPYGCPAPPSV